MSRVLPKGAAAILGTAHRRAAGFMLAVIAAAAPATLHAQTSETTLISPTIPQGFDRGRNVSVVERPRPDYDPIGIPVGPFNAYPRVDIGAGGTSNVYLADGSDKTAAPLIYVNPSIHLNSDWSRHLLVLTGSAQLRRFIGESRRNEDAWNLGALGRLDVGSSTAITGEAQVGRQFETPFSGEISSQFVALSHYLRNFESLRAEYQAGQGRAILVVDNTGFDFDRIKLGNGRYTDQSERDRDIVRITGQVEYAFTPSVSVYGQGAVAFTDYDQRLFNGDANLDSNGYRFIAGVNFDLAGLARGTIGAGYVRRDYKSPLYKDVGGFSIEGRIQYFPSELTTYTLALRRVIEDSSLSSSTAFFDDRISLQVDHEVLNNLLINASGEFARQDYIGSPERANVYRVEGGARYLLSRVLGIDVGISYTARDTRGDQLGGDFSEIRGQIGISLQR